MAFIKKYLITFIGLLLSIISIVLLTILSYPTFVEQRVSFESSYKDKQVTLEGSYYNVDNSEYAVLICPGYSCDRQKWRVFSNLFVKNGITTMTFDYSGQGESSGSIGFDNAKTDAIPTQIDDAITFLHNKSNIDYDHIILVGHSMGGRAILRLLFDYNDNNAQTKIEYKPIKNVILFSPEVNYEYNAQSSLFAGTSDATEYPWKDFNINSTKGVNLYLYGSTSDDIVSEYDVLAIFNKLGGNAPLKGKYEDSIVNSNGDKITVGVTSGVLHSYIMYSPKFASYANSALASIGITTSFNSFLFSFVYIGWFSAIIGLFLILFGLNRNYKNKEVDEITSTITNTKKYLLYKLLMWIPGMILAFVICCIIMVMPWGSPVMNTPYMCFIAGYGLTILIHFAKGRFKGVDGYIVKPTFKIKQEKKDIFITTLIVIGVLFISWYVFFNTMYRLIPFNTRLIYLFIATILMTVAYYISSFETDMLKKNNASKLTLFLYNLIQYVPLFIFVLFYAVIGSFSGFIGQMVNMLLMYTLCLPLGNYIKNKTNNRLYGALTTAFLFQVIMITSAAIISFF